MQLKKLYRNTAAIFLQYFSLPVGKKHQKYKDPSGNAQTVASCQLTSQQFHNTFGTPSE